MRVVGRVGPDKVQDTCRELGRAVQIVSRPSDQARPRFPYLNQSWAQGEPACPVTVEPGSFGPEKQALVRESRHLM